ncbi:hypothetical protein TELCIR_04136 [Teladorsagia circumcincta]|uniref:Uncharacterized protein n=1 Tax=Teladorsagia circumcincta TaxID=45464 RepID=A0A2G9UUG4_TELCI|nr:hypothetical protein TELCIR_04136 [Teladorsagia circumcincta]
MNLVPTNREWEEVRNERTTKLKRITVLEGKPSDKSKRSSDSSKVSGLIKSSDESITLAEDSTQRSENVLPPVDTKSSQSRTNVRSSSWASSFTTEPPIRIAPTQADGTESTQLGTDHTDEFHGRSKAEVEAEMATDRESERDKSKEALKKPGAPDPKVKWGDSKCVVFETTEEPTLDEDEVQEEPDLW